MASMVFSNAQPGIESLAIEARQLVRRFGGVEALAGVSLAVRKGEFFSLLGPSGCGKTTLLRLVAGLDRPDSGSLRIGGHDALPVPPHRRPVNTVFQSYALFPHLSVRENVAFGLVMRKRPKGEIKERVDRILALTETTELASRKPSQLSGGQKQRVALARAVVNEPEILLLDEPLGALDLKLRQQLQRELRDLQRRLGLTFLYVTHDQEEALSLSDRIAVLNHGKVEQSGAVDELYERPRRRFVAQFLGGCNLLPARMVHANGRTLAATEWGNFHLPTPPAAAEFTFAIRPERVELRPPTEDSRGIMATVRDLIYRGAATEYLLEHHGHRLRAAVLNTGAGRAAFEPGQSARVVISETNLVVLED